MSSAKIPPETWYIETPDAEGVDRCQPSIYRWTIEGAGVYIGQYTRIRP